jgi:short-subunit dehydrogenase
MIIWITGASDGIGKAVALAYLLDGHSVVGTGRSADKLTALELEAAPLPGQFRGLAADVADKVAMALAWQQAKDATGLPDILILNAGTHFETPVEAFSVDDHRTIMDVNYFGVLNSLEPLLGDLMVRGHGQVAIVSSLAGYRGLPPASAYGASKAALINFTETFQPELARHNIDLRLVNPGFVETPLTDQNSFPMPFLISAEKAAERLIKGLDGKRFEITFPRRFAFVMKLLRILPYGLYLRLTKRLLRESD